MKTKITNIRHYSGFNELTNEFDITLLADRNVSKDKLIKTLNEIYSKEKQDKYGVVALEFEIIKEDTSYENK